MLQTNSSSEKPILQEQEQLLDSFIPNSDTEVDNSETEKPVNDAEVNKDSAPSKETTEILPETTESVMKANETKYRVEVNEKEGNYKKYLSISRLSTIYIIIILIVKTKDIFCYENGVQGCC